MASAKRQRLTPINSFDGVPAFRSEEEEQQFWSTHSLGDAILAQMGPLPDDVLPPPRPRTRPLAVRFEEDTLRRLKALAERKHTGYQTLLKRFVLERLYEEEKREGLVER